MHMINRNCSWEVLVGGNQFMVFYLDRRLDGNDTYYHLVLSGRHATFPQAATPGIPGLIQVLIALLLGDTSIIQYTPPRVTIGARYLMGTGSATLAKKTGKDAGRKAAGSVGKGTGRHRHRTGRHRHRTGLETPVETLLDGIQVTSRTLKSSPIFES